MQNYKLAVRHSILVGLVLAAYSKVGATPLPSATLPELVQRADVICVGTVNQIEDQGTAPFDTGIFMDGKPFFTEAEKCIADFTVEEALKGGLTDHTIKIAFPQTIATPGPNGIPFAELKKGERIIIFIRRNADRSHFVLLAPSNFPPPKLRIGNFRLKARPNDVTPLRGVLLYLAGSLSDTNKTVVLDCLDRLQSISFLLYNSVSMFPSQTIVNLRQDIQEPPAANLEAFVKSQILPQVVKLTSVPDKEISKRALITAAKLQDVEIIPQLVKLAKNNDSTTSPREVAYAIKTFRAPGAVKVLIPLLKDDTVALRQSAAYALREIAEPTSVPFLIESLDDPDAQVRSFAISALYLITDKQPPVMAGAVMTEKDHIGFWKKWAAEHADKLKVLRERLAQSP